MVARSAVNPREANKEVELRLATDVLVEAAAAEAWAMPMEEMASELQASAGAVKEMVLMVAASWVAEDGVEGQMGCGVVSQADVK